MEDVAVHKPDGTLVLEQTKSATAQNPVSDWSTELWKTIANWADAIKAGDVAVANTLFKLYVTPEQTGTLAEILNAANSDAAADDAVSVITSELQELPRKPRCYSYITKFLELDVLSRRLLIKHFTLQSDRSDPVDAIRDLIKSTVSESMVDTCCSYAIGKAKETVDKLIREHATPILNAGQFQKEFRAFVHKHDLSAILASLSPPPSGESVSATVASSPLFIKQLDIVEVSSDLKLRAASDYLQASAAKTEWAAAGKIVDSSLAEFDRDLVRKHAFIKAEIDETHSDRDAKSRGRMLYIRCADSSMKLEGREVPGFFPPGCYNDLAERLELGWHPNFRTILKEGDEE